MNRAELVATLELLYPALSDSDPIPLFQCFSFTGKHALAYNDSKNGLAIIAPCKTEEIFAVNGKVLLGLLKNSQSDDVDFTKTDEHDITVKAGKSRFRMPFHSEEDFLFKEPTGKASLEIPADDVLLAGLDACMITASKDLTQEAFLGVILKPYNKSMAFYSCDGDALTRFALKVKPSEVRVRLPNEFCEAILRTAKETNTSFQSIKIIGDEWAKAQYPNGIVIYGRLLKPEDPFDHEEQLAKTIKGKVTYKPVPKVLDSALSRARVVADPESAKTVLEVADGKLLLHTETHMGVVNDSMTWREHPEIKADVSAGLVQRALALCDEMALQERCTVYRKEPDLFILVSNMG